MNRLLALSAGSHAETERFTGAVHSVFARACNIALDDGRLVALLGAEHGNAPHAVRVEAPAALAFDRFLRVGQVAACRAGVLRSGALAVRVNDAPRWTAGLGALRADLREPAVRAAWLAVRRGLDRQQVPAGIGCFGVNREHILALWRAARSRDTVGGAATVTSLVGRGPGLTPAGDDILVGFLAALRASACANPADAGFLGAIGAAVCAAAPRTNAISAAYLRGATEGEVGERLVDLLAAIAGGAADASLHRALAAALAVGATSGRDGVRGLLVGLAGFAPGEIQMEPLP